ncbi:unannotated protein [freshwater metagenome]|uniref:Unannotated protein n=1 Tax=freshwater metagenome TaxID=449393 RepID=A0A6J7RNA7_9ZZZZ
MELHGVRCSALCTRPEVGTVSEHFRERYLSTDNLRVTAGFHPFNTATTAGKVSHDVAHVFIGGYYFNTHDWLKKNRLCHFSSLFKSHLTSNFERHFAGVNIVVLAVDQAHLDVNCGVPGKNTCVEGLLNTLVRWLDVFARNFTASNFVDEHVTAAWA